MFLFLLLFGKLHILHGFVINKLFSRLLILSIYNNIYKKYLYI